MPPKGKSTTRKRFFIRVYSIAMSELGSAARQESIHQWVLENPDLWRHRFPEPPAESTGKAYIKEIREAQQDPWLDEEWSIGASVWKNGKRIEVPSDALPDVIAVWRRALVGGRKLTCRQVHWLVRLRDWIRSETPDVPDGGEFYFMRLYAAATEYSSAERAAEATGEDLETTLTDARIAFGTLEMRPDAVEPRMASFWLAAELGTIPEPVPTFTSDDPWEWFIDTRDARFMSMMLQEIVEERHDRPWPSLSLWQRELLLISAQFIAARMDLGIRNLAAGRDAFEEVCEVVVNERYLDLWPLLGLERKSGYGQVMIRYGVTVEE